MSDVRDILELNQAPQVPTYSKKVTQLQTSHRKSSHSSNLPNESFDIPSKAKQKRQAEPLKRPQGVHREVWGLICKDREGDQPPLIPADEPKLYKHPKAKLRYGVRKWHWVAFCNPARTDSAMFSHWRCVNDDPDKEYPFAKYNKV
jgi:DNA methyltransferase 1-associated protein 1